MFNDWFNMSNRWIIMPNRWIAMSNLWIVMFIYWFDMSNRWITMSSRWIVVSNPWFAMSIYWFEMFNHWITMSYYEYYVKSCCVVISDIFIIYKPEVTVWWISFLPFSNQNQRKIFDMWLYLDFLTSSLPLTLNLKFAFIVIILKRFEPSA